jgi:hypothetical protein
VLVEPPLHPLADLDQGGEEIRQDGVLNLYQHTPADVGVGSDLSDLWKYVEIERVRLFVWQPKTCRTFGSLSGVPHLLPSCSHVESAGMIFEKVPQFQFEPVRKCPCGLEASTGFCSWKRDRRGWSEKALWASYSALDHTFKQVCSLLIRPLVLGVLGRLCLASRFIRAGSLAGRINTIIRDSGAMGGLRIP